MSGIQTIWVTLNEKQIPQIVGNNRNQKKEWNGWRRSFYLRVEHPTAEREAEIVALRTPDSSREFHAGMEFGRVSFQEGDILVSKLCEVLQRNESCLVVVQHNIGDTLVLPMSGNHDRWHWQRVLQIKIDDDYALDPVAATAASSISRRVQRRGDVIPVMKKYSFSRAQFSMPATTDEP
jgi:hypothetical protein